VLFETGYGPSGLPHIGTFGEVVRTTMVRQAFKRLSDIPTRLFCFSDDMDGLRKVPDNVPNKEMLAANLGKPLTSVPDPFSNEHPSFGAANNARLRAFLDSFGFEYEFQSATDWYKSGRFDKMLLAMLQHYDEVQAIMLPTLGEERRATYSIFLPISPKTGRVLQVPVIKTDANAGTIVYRDEDGTLVETPVTGGNVKLQWKADWAGRWFALDVDYEMYGKDLIPSAELSAKIVRILGGTPPEGFNFELFLDEEGKKISKSKGNGLSVEEWLRYAPPESLALYMQQQPRRAKRLYFDVIPRAVDDYLSAVEKLPAEEPAKALENAAWHIHDGKPVDHHSAGINFGMLLNLASVAHTDSKDVKASKKFRLPAGKEREALQDLADTLAKLPEESTAEFIQNEVYEAGKRHFAQAELRQWFKTLYEVLLGSEQGPRMGAFIKLYGRDNVVKLIERALAGEDLSRAA
jgi:lysyl-tRNA synthetase class 1